jgi:hypothetical protein
MMLRKNSPATELRCATTLAENPVLMKGIIKIRMLNQAFILFDELIRDGKAVWLTKAEIAERIYPITTAIACCLKPGIGCDKH